MLSRLPLVAGLLASLALTAQAPAEAADRRFYPAEIHAHNEYREPAYRPYAAPHPQYRPVYRQPAYYGPPHHPHHHHPHPPYREYRRDYHRDYDYRDSRW